MTRRKEKMGAVRANARTARGWRGMGLCAAMAMMAGAIPAHAEHATLLAKSVYQNIYGIAVDKFGVYVTGSTALLRDPSGQTGVVGLIPLAGGVVTTLYSSGDYASDSGRVTPMQIATNGWGKLVWSDPDAGGGTGSAMLTGDHEGAVSTRILDTCCGPSAFPGDVFGATISRGGVIYFSDAAGGGVGKISDGSPEQIGQNRYGPDFDIEQLSQIAVSGDRVFLADSGQSIWYDNGVQTVVDQSASAGSGVRVLDTGTGSTIEDLTTDIANPHGVVVVGKYLYVTTAKAVWRVKISNGRVALVSRDKHFVDLQGIAYYDGALYVADDQNTYGPEENGVAHATQDLPGVVWKITP